MRLHYLHERTATCSLVAKRLLRTSSCLVGSVVERWFRRTASRIQQSQRGSYNLPGPFLVSRKYDVRTTVCVHDYHAAVSWAGKLEVTDEAGRIKAMQLVAVLAENHEEHHIEVG